MLLLLGVLGCRPDKTTSAPAPDDTTDTADSGPPAWADWPAQPAEGLRALLDVPLPGAVSPATVETLPGRSLSVIWDPGAAAAWVLDARYRHSSDAACISAASWPGWVSTGQQRSCPDGKIFTRRGTLSVPAGVQAVAVDPAGLQVMLLDADGQLWRADADPLRGNPLDHLRPALLDLPARPDATDIAFTDTGILLITEGAALTHLNPDTGATATDDSLPEPILAAHEAGDVTWIRTSAGLYCDGALLSGTAGAAGMVAVADGGLVYADLDAGAVVSLGADGVEAERVSVAGLRGPLAVGARTYAVTDAGIAVAGTDVLFAGDFEDVAVNSAHEVVALGSTGATVLGDEDLLAAASAPVSLMIAAFVERPRSTGSDAPCRGDSSVATFAAQAGANAAVLSDIPAAVALGLTPHFARRAAACDALVPLAPLLEAPQVGALFHEQHGCDSEDTSCIADFLAAEAAEVSALGVTLAFTSGLSPQDGDWVAALEAAGLPERYLFFGASILEDVDADGDPRAKDAWPLEARAPLWRARAPDDIGARGDAGWLVVQPGDNLPAFNLSACDNLFLRECHAAVAGDGPTIDAEDAAVLVLMARRAIAEQAGPSAWSFHLPDLGVYDYAAGCTVEDGAWSGESCPAARLQEWSREIHTRYVLNGLAQWAGPADVEAP